MVHEKIILKLKSVYYDHDNGRLYCDDDKRNSWVLVNTGTCRKPCFVPHSVTNEGEPLSPILSSINWMLIDGEDDTEFVPGLSNNCHLIIFKSTDGFLFIFNEEEAVFTDGDLSFEINETGYPVDSVGKVISGEMIGMLCHSQSNEKAINHLLLVKRNVLYSNLEIIDKELNALCKPYKQSNGFLPAEFRGTDKYKELNKKHGEAFSMLTRFNASIPNKVKLEWSEQRRNQTSII